MKSVSKILSCLFASMISAEAFIPKAEVLDHVEALKGSEICDFGGIKYAFLDKEEDTRALWINHKLFIYSADHKEMRPLKVAFFKFKSNVLYLQSCDEIFAVPMQVVNDNFQLFVWDGAQYVSDKRCLPLAATSKLGDIIQGICKSNFITFRLHGSFLSITIGGIPLIKIMNQYETSSEVCERTEFKVVKHISRQKPEYKFDESTNTLYIVTKTSCTKVVYLLNKYGGLSGHAEIYELINPVTQKCELVNPATQKYRLASHQSVHVPVEIKKLLDLISTPETSSGKTEDPDDKDLRLVCAGIKPERAVHGRSMAIITRSESTQHTHGEMKCYQNNGDTLVIYGDNEAVAYLDGGYYVGNMRGKSGTNFKLKWAMLPDKTIYTWRTPGNNNYRYTTVSESEKTKLQIPQEVIDLIKTQHQDLSTGSGASSSSSIKRVAELDLEMGVGD